MTSLSLLISKDLFSARKDSVYDQTKSQLLISEPMLYPETSEKAQRKAHAMICIAVHYSECIIAVHPPRERVPDN